MLRDWTCHADYQESVRKELDLMTSSERSRLSLFKDSLSKLFLLNLDPLLPIIKPLYSVFGRPSQNQCEIFRSLILMLDRKVYSITRWAQITASDNIIRMLCGFKPGNVPGLASYYDLLFRIWLSPRKSRKSSLKTPYRKPNKKLKANQKMPCKHAGSVDKLVTHVIKGGKLPDFRPERILQELLKHCVVEPSAQLGLLGDLSNFSVAFDGSSFYAGSSHTGAKICDCRKNGIHNCNCQRHYSDPDAHWGWDSYREQHFYGDTLFNVVASDSPYDLPIYMRSVQASRHDSVTTVFALGEIKKLYPDLSIRNLLADGAMDSYAIYKLLKHHGILPFIPLAKTAKYPQKHLPVDVIGFTTDGTPICPRGLPYVYWGPSHTRNRLKYRCPLAVRDKRRPINFTCSCKSTSDYGRTIYIKPDDDPRLFPPVPRDTRLFKETYKRRTTVERGNKRIFEDYQVEACRSRSSRLRFSMATFAAINIHLDAWIKHLGILPVDLGLAA